MSHLHPSANLLVTHQELARLDEFSQADGLELSRRLLTGQPGLFAPTGTEWLVSVDNPVDQTLQLSAGLALDARGRLLRTDQLRGIALPAPDVWYYLRASYATHSLEPGTVSIGANGQLVGDANCRFSQVLRGLPGCPTLIRLVKADGTASLNGGIDHEVQAVADNRSATLSSAGLVVETGLRYQVVGAFQFGWQPAQADLLIYRYDGVRLFVMDENFDLDVTPYPEGFEPAEAFNLARVRRTANGLDVEDKRSAYWQAAGETTLAALRAGDSAHPHIGLERLCWPPQGTPQAESLAAIAYGLRSNAWSLDPAQRQITLTQAAGGRVLDLSQAVASDYVNWYVTRAGQLGALAPSAGAEPRWRITAATKPTATTLRLTLAGIDPSDLPDPARPLLLLPDAEHVHFDVTPLAGPGTPGVARYHSAPLGAGLVELALPCGGAATDYFIQYCFSTGKRRTAWRPLPSTLHYAEDAFDGAGLLLPGAVRAGTLNPAAAGQVRVAPAPEGYQARVQRVEAADTGDLPGVEARSITTAVPALPLRVGEHRRHQLLDVGLLLAQNQYLNLLPTRRARGGASVPLVEGNSFSLELRGDLRPGQYALALVTAYVDPANPGTPLVAFDARDRYAMKNGGLFVTCAYGAGAWHVFKHRRTEMPLGSVLLLNRLGAYNPLAKFDPLTGLGSAEWQDYALMDGRNGTDDMGGLTAVGFNAAGPAAPVNSTGARDALGINLLTNTGTLGNFGGLHQITMTVGEMPNHSHAQYQSANPGTNNQGNATTKTDAANGGLLAFATAATGDGLPHENRMPYRVLAYVQRIA